MLQKFPEGGEAAGTGTMEGEEDIIVRVSGVGGERSVGGKKSETPENPKNI